jgi:hypothetical protein
MNDLIKAELAAMLTEWTPEKGPTHEVRREVFDRLHKRMSTFDVYNALTRFDRGMALGRALYESDWN